MNQDCCIELNSSIAQQRRAILRENEYDINQNTITSPTRNQRNGAPYADEESKVPNFDLKDQRTHDGQINLEDSSRTFSRAQNSSILDSSEVRLHMNDPSSRHTASTRDSTNERDRQNPPAVNLAQNNVAVPVQPEPAAQYRPWTVRDEAKCILRRVTEAYLFLIGTYGFSLMIMKGVIPFYSLFGFLVAACLFQTLRTIRAPNGRPGITNRQKRAKYFRVVDWLCLISFLVLSALRIEVTDIPLAPFVAPGIINTFLCYFLSDPYNSMIKPRTVVFYKLVFWCQMLLIGLKADGAIENWAFVFVALFYTLVFFMSVSVGFFILAFSYVCQAFHLEGFDCNIVGLIWDFLNALFSWVWGFTLLGLIEELRHEGDSALLVPGLIAGLTHCSLLMIFTLLLRKNLIAYLTSTLQLIVGLDDMEVPSPAFETIKGNIPYLLKVSPTYYMVINDEFRFKDKQHAEGCKNQLKEVKRQRKQSITIPKRVKIEDGVVVDVPEHKSATVRMEANSIRAKKAETRVLSSENTPDITKDKVPSLCYSDDDADGLEQVKQKAEKNHQNEEVEQTCMICCMNAPNAVFMKCGHSGVCYSCALETWKKGDKCALCRRPIDEILKVSVVSGVNVAKVIEGTKKYPTLTSLDDLED